MSRNIGLPRKGYIFCERGRHFQPISIKIGLSIPKIVIFGMWNVKGGSSNH